MGRKNGKNLVKIQNKIKRDFFDARKIDVFILSIQNNHPAVLNRIAIHPT